MTVFDPRSPSQERFGRFAQSYVESSTHAQGDDLERLLALAAPQPDWRALDIATGGGHTALKIAPHVQQVVALDLAAPMLEAARSFIASRDVRSVRYVNAEADRLPFAAASLDLVTCRIAPHHFPDVARFVEECARVLRPGGRLVVQDQVIPDDKRAALYLEAFEAIRDPSHHRCYDQYQWQGMYLDAGLRVDAVEMPRKRASLLTWAHTQRCTPYIIERLQIMLAQAPQRVAEHLQPQCAGTADASFDHVYILIAGTKMA